MCIVSNLQGTVSSVKVYSCTFLQKKQFGKRVLKLSEKKLTTCNLYIMVCDV